MSMSTAELKNDLHKLIVETEDSDVLENVKIYFTNLTSQSDWWDNISGKEKELIERGLEDVEAGRVVPHSKVKERIRKTIEKHKQ